jgi:hypothetical protein
LSIPIRLSRVATQRPTGRADGWAITGDGRLTDRATNDERPRKHVGDPVPVDFFAVLDVGSHQNPHQRSQSESYHVTLRATPAMFRAPYSTHSINTRLCK